MRAKRDANLRAVPLRDHTSLSLLSIVLLINLFEKCFFCREIVLMDLFLLLY